MSFYEFELATGEDLVIEKTGEYIDGSLDLSVEFGNEYRYFDECNDAYEVMEWIAEAGGRFATAKTALFNYAYLQSIIDGDWSDESFAHIVAGNPEKWLTKEILAACGAKADEAEEDVPEAEDGGDEFEDDCNAGENGYEVNIELVDEILDFCKKNGIEWYIDLFYASRHRRDWHKELLHHPEFWVAVLESMQRSKAN